MLLLWFKNKRSIKIILTVLALLSVPLAVIYTNVAIANKPLPEQKPATARLPEVSVLSVKPTSHQAHIIAHGEALPHFKLALVSEVTGKVESISSKLAIGQLVKENTVITTIDPMNYLQDVEDAKVSLRDALLSLSQEQLEAQHAPKSWQGNTPPKSVMASYSLREPKLALVNAQVEQAKLKLANAKKMLEKTKVKAPYDAIIIERNIQLGQYVTEGDKVATLHSTQRIDVPVSIALSDWKNLPSRSQLLSDTQVTLTDDKGNQWQGKITEVSQHIDALSRQKQLIISVYDPLEQVQPLYAGTFVKAMISGRTQQNLLKVPATSLTSDGVVWYVDEQQLLANFQPDVSFSEAGNIFIKLPFSASSLNILTKPLPAYVVGQKVKVIPAVIGEG